MLKRSCFLALHRLTTWTLALVAFVGCTESSPSPANNTTSRALDASWEFRQMTDDEWLPATVPGDVMTDLLSANIIPDPFDATAERDVQWVENQDWIYRCIFDVNTAPFSDISPLQELYFEGLDTFAEVRINGKPCLKTDNMHRRYALSIPEGTASPCTLEVILNSPVRSGEAVLAALPRLIPTSNEDKPIGERTSSVTRKAKYQFGWDWGPRLTSCGIWRPVYLRNSQDVSADDIGISLYELLENEATYIITGPSAIEKGTLTLAGPELSPINYTFDKWQSNQCTLRVKQPELWWPHGMGEQPLYTLNWNVPNQELTIRFGIRKMELNRAKDEWGSEFEFAVNGQPFFAKGANIIPPDFFPARAHAFEDRLIKDATDANMNMLRIWGGGVYPSKTFLDKCDEQGLLIWQDFMFACGMVRGDAAHQNNIKSEATDQLKRMRNHPSIALLCGNNESIHAWENWGWPEAFALHNEDSIATEQAYRAVFDTLLPRTIDSLTDLAYWPSSPMIDPKEDHTSLSGDVHAWRVWFDTLDFDYYSAHKGRFASEYGLQSLPNLQTLQEVGITGWGDEALQFRQRSKMEWLEAGLDGWGMMRIYARRYTADPSSIDNQADKDPEALLKRWIYLSQLTQAVGLQEAIERHRNSKGRIAGSLYWQLDDVWPTVSWSTVDYAGRWKLAHHAVRHANADCRAIWSRIPGEIGRIQFHNQRPNAIEKSQFVVEWRDATGAIQATEMAALSVNPFQTLERTFPKPKNACPIVTWTWTSDSGEIIDKGHQLFSKPSEIHWPEAEIQIMRDGLAVALRSDSIAYGVRLVASEKGRFSENGILILPGIENTQRLTFLPSDIGSATPGHIKVQHLGEFQ